LDDFSNVNFYVWFMINVVLLILTCCNCDMFYYFNWD